MHHAAVRLRHPRNPLNLRNSYFAFCTSHFALRESILCRS